MNHYIIIGIIGGILCAQAGVLLAWSGRKKDVVNLTVAGMKL